MDRTWKIKKYYIFPIVVMSICAFFVLILKSPPSNVDLPKLTDVDKIDLLKLSHETIRNYFEKTNSSAVHSDKFSDKFQGIRNRVFVSIRLDGIRHGSWSAQTDHLAKSVQEATIHAVKDQRFDNSNLAYHMNRIKVEIYIIGPYHEITVATLVDTKDGYEHGVHGVFLEKDERTAFFYNSVAIEENWNEMELPRHLCIKASMPANCFGDSSVKKFWFPTIHFGDARFSNEMVTFYRNDPVDSQVDILPNHENTVQIQTLRDEVLKSKNLGLDWIYRNQMPEGFFSYQYETEINKWSNENDVVRQLLTSRTVAESANHDEGALIAHERNLKWIISSLYHETVLENNKSIGWIDWKGDQNIGAISFAIRTLLRSPFKKHFERQLERLTRTLLSMHHDDGSLEINPLHISRKSNPEFDENSPLIFYSGEVILALLDLYEFSKLPVYLIAAESSERYYLTRYDDLMKKQFVPYFIPWYVMTLNRLLQLKRDIYYENQIFSLADQLMRIQDQQGRFVNPLFGPWSTSDAIDTEGMIHALEWAKLSGNAERERLYRLSAIRGIRNLLGLHFRGEKMHWVPEPKFVDGAIRGSAIDSTLRLDATAHSVEAMQKFLKVF